MVEAGFGSPARYVVEEHKTSNTFRLVLCCLPSDNSLQTNPPSFSLNLTMLLTHTKHMWVHHKLGRLSKTGAGRSSTLPSHGKALENPPPTPSKNDITGARRGTSLSNDDTLPSVMVFGGRLVFRHI